MLTCALVYLAATDPSKDYLNFRRARPELEPILRWSNQRLYFSASLILELFVSPLLILLRLLSDNCFVSDAGSIHFVRDTQSCQAALNSPYRIHNNSVNNPFIFSSPRPRAPFSSATATAGTGVRLARFLDTLKQPLGDNTHKSDLRLPLASEPSLTNRGRDKGPRSGRNGLDPDQSLSEKGGSEPLPSCWIRTSAFSARRRGRRAGAEEAKALPARRTYRSRGVVEQDGVGGTSPTLEHRRCEGSKRVVEAILVDEPFVDVG